MSWEAWAVAALLVLVFSCAAFFAHRDARQTAVHAKREAKRVAGLSASEHRAEALRLLAKSESCPYVLESNAYASRAHTHALLGMESGQ